MSTLPTYRRALAKKAGEMWLITTGAQATPPSGSYVGKGNATLAQRIIASSDLVSIQSGTVTGELPVDMLNEAWAYALTSTPEQRRISKDSFTSYALASAVLDAGTTTPVGYAYADRNWAAILPASTVVEIHHKYPVLDTFGRSGLHTFINRALGILQVADRLTVAGVTDQYRYSLATYPWITQESQLIAVYGSESPSGTEPPLLSGGGKIRIDGHIPYLIVDTPTATGSDFYIDVYRPRSSWIKVSGTWAESTVGLVNETDEASADTTALVNVAWYLMCDDMVNRPAPPGDIKEWVNRRAVAAAIAQPHIQNQELQAQSRLDPSIAGGADSLEFIRRQGIGTLRRNRRRWP